MPTLTVQAYPVRGNSAEPLWRNYVCQCTVVVTENSVNQTNNTSNCSVKISAKCVSPPGYSWTPTKRSTAGYCRLYVNGEQKASVPLPIQAGTGTFTLVSETTTNFTIPHNNDGTKTVTLQAKIIQGSDPNNYQLYYNAANSSTQNWTLTTIGRFFKLWFNDNGTWRKARRIWFNDNGTWREAKRIWFNDNGTWREAKKG